jgi:hypothetical protein
MVVVIDAAFDSRFEVTRHEGMFQQNVVLGYLVPTLDFALDLWVVWRAARVLHAFVLQPFSQFSLDVVGSVVAEQPRLMNDVDLVTS